MSCWVWWVGHFLWSRAEVRVCSIILRKRSHGWNIHLFEDGLPYWKWRIFHCHVSFQECSPPPKEKNTHIPYSQQNLLLVLCFIDHSHLSLGLGVSHGSQLFLWWSTCLTPSSLHLVIPGGANQKKHCWNKSLTSMIIHKLHKWSFWRQWSKSEVIATSGSLEANGDLRALPMESWTKNDQQTTGWCDATSDGRWFPTSFELNPFG